MFSAQSVLKSVFGFDSFRPGQEEIIDRIVAGENLLAVMPTGAGKSLCYQIPALLFDRPTIIISPLVALMDNQVAGLRANGVNVAAIHSGQSRADNVIQWRSVTHGLDSANGAGSLLGQQTDNGKAKLLYLSPERLMSPRMISAIRALNPAMFVIDEAHCVSKWGPAFRPEYDQLQELKTLFPTARIAAFTATADALTRDDIAAKLFGRDGSQIQGKTIVHGFDRPNINVAVSPAKGRNQQLLALMERVKGQAGIVYCLSRKTTENVTTLLQQNGYKALPYHAGMETGDRFNNLERFMAEEAVVMVATIAFGMGIDKPDIRFVFHMNLPSSLEAYYQEIGRAGRDGGDALTHLIYGMDDARLRRQFIRDDGSDDDHQARELKRLDSLIAFCEASTCRRQILMQYFGERSQPCGNCDNCENPPKMIDATEHMRHVLGAIRATGGRYGPAYISDIVRGAPVKRALDLGHDRLDVFGAGKYMGKPVLQALMRQGINAGLIHSDLERYGVLCITPAGQAVLSGEAEFKCRDIIADQKRAKTRQGRSGIGRKTGPSESELGQADRALLLRLKARRAELARAASVPAYVIFSDAALIDMARKRPMSRSDMLGVSGVGDVKFNRYGVDFIDVISR